MPAKDSHGINWFPNNFHVLTTNDWDEFNLGINILGAPYITMEDLHRSLGNGKVVNPYTGRQGYRRLTTSESTKVRLNVHSKLLSANTGYIDINGNPYTPPEGWVDWTQNHHLQKPKYFKYRIHTYEFDSDEQLTNLTIGPELTATNTGWLEIPLTTTEAIAIEVTEAKDAQDRLAIPPYKAVYGAAQHSLSGWYHADPAPSWRTEFYTNRPESTPPFSVTISKPKDGYGYDRTEITEGDEYFWSITKTGGDGSEDLWYKIVGDSTGGNTPTVPGDFSNPQGELHGTQFVPRAKTSDGTEPDKYFKIEIYSDSGYTNLLVTSDVMKLIDDGTGGGTSPPADPSADPSSSSGAPVLSFIDHGGNNIELNWTEPTPAPATAFWSTIKQYLVFGGSNEAQVQNNYASEVTINFFSNVTTGMDYNGSQFYGIAAVEDFSSGVNTLGPLSNIVDVSSPPVAASHGGVAPANVRLTVGMANSIKIEWDDIPGYGVYESGSTSDTYTIFRTLNGVPPDGGGWTSMQDQYDNYVHQVGWCAWMTGLLGNDPVNFHTDTDSKTVTGDKYCYAVAAYDEATGVLGPLSNIACWTNGGGMSSGGSGGYGAGAGAGAGSSPPGIASAGSVTAAPSIITVPSLPATSEKNFDTSGGSILLLHSDQNPPSVTEPVTQDFFDYGYPVSSSSSTYNFLSDLKSGVVLTNNSYNTIFYYLMDAAQNIIYLGYESFYVDRNKPIGTLTAPSYSSPYTAEWLGKNKPAPFNGRIDICDNPGSSTTLTYPY